jgi:translation initiation factor eIF-2B subunit delta
VVVDSRPALEGRRMLHSLLSAGVHCQYIQLNGLSFGLAGATKVILGAAAVLSNGTVLGRAGSAAVAMLAAEAHIPVLVCAETHKFHERVQLDSFTHNELGDPDAVVALPGDAPGGGGGGVKGKSRRWLDGWKEHEQLGVLNLMYDAMPADYVGVILSEVGALPPTSVPVVLREYQRAGSAY